MTNYLGKFSHSTVATCIALRKLMSVKTEWTWNATMLVNKSSCHVLDSLKFIDEMFRCTIQKTITVVNVTENEGMDE